MSLRLVLAACVLAACSASSENADAPDDDHPSTSTAITEPTAAPTAAPSASGVDATSKFQHKICTQMGCIDRWELKLSGKDGKPLPPAVYVVELAAGGKKQSCTLDAKTETKVPSCKGDDLGGTWSASSVVFQTAPASLDVTITRAGKKLLTKSVSPTLKEVRPNGPDCGPACKQGSDELVVD